MITSGQDVIRRSYECLNNRDLDGLAELLDEQYVMHDRSDENIVRGREAGVEWFRRYVEAFPDMRVEAVEMVSEGDLVFARWTVRGRNDGPLEGMEPTHREVTVHGMECDRVRNGKIVESWNQWDAMGFYEQLGVMQPQQAAASS